MATAAAADSHTEADLRQLQGLCEREDGEAFLPLRSEEFGLDFPRRMLGFRRLVDDATDRGIRAGFISVKDLKVTPQAWGYGRYLHLAREKHVVRSQSRSLGSDVAYARSGLCLALNAVHLSRFGERTALNFSTTGTSRSICRSGGNMKPCSMPSLSVLRRS